MNVREQANYIKQWHGELELHLDCPVTATHDDLKNQLENGINKANMIAKAAAAVQTELNDLYTVLIDPNGWDPDAPLTMTSIGKQICADAKLGIAAREAADVSEF